MAAELWTISALARFVSAGAQAAGFARLANAGKSTVWRILMGIEKFNASPGIFRRNKFDLGVT